MENQAQRNRHIEKATQTWIEVFFPENEQKQQFTSHTAEPSWPQLTQTETQLFLSLSPSLCLCERMESVAERLFPSSALLKERKLMATLSLYVSRA